MFDWDKWQEIFSTIRRNKLRTFLTAFSVAWGIFMLILLLGMGKGLENYVIYQFRDDAINSIWVSSGETSIPYQGMQPGRDIQLRNRDLEDIKRDIAGVEHTTARFSIPSNTVISFGKENGRFNVRSVHPGHQHIENTIIQQGRYLNQRDIDENRKVVVIGHLIAQSLFKGVPPLGKYLDVGGIPFRVVGIFIDEGGPGENETLYLPISTAQRAFGGQDRINRLMFTTGDAPIEETEKMADQVRLFLAQRHNFSPSDPRAIDVNNNAAEFKRFADLLQGISIFVLVIGIGTLMVGMVGVGNIMVIVVKERTREIGVRKSLGATPWSIISLIIQESIFITAAAGYVGLVIGVGFLELINYVLTNFVPDLSYMDPTVNLPTAIYATLLLVVIGIFAGLIPARRAASINPIEALRDE
ncbi:MAG: ABC transporter permease [Bacteroidota bacterium]